ncbi:hypothetical protein DRP04_09280 [Archaeoglobales archaeon]|nr:MAG: hypothetical protein DRP04_09280 [Archaeoglobales archaeon]
MAIIKIDISSSLIRLKQDLIYSPLNPSWVSLRVPGKLDNFNKYITADAVIMTRGKLKDKRYFVVFSVGLSDKKSDIKL